MNTFLRFFLAIIFILGLIFLLGWWNKAHSWVLETLVVSTRVSRFLTGEIAGAVEFVTSLPKMSTENQELKKENLGLQQLKSQNLALQQENEALRNQLGILGAQEVFLTPLRVLGEIFRSGEPFLVVEGGENLGLRPGRVVVWENFLVGQLAQVGPWNSLVQPVFSPQIRVPAQAVSAEGSLIAGLLKGETAPQQGVVFGEVSIEEQLEPGEVVETSGVLGDYPAGLIIGKLVEVERVENQVYQQARVALPWKLSELRVVFVQ